MEWTAFKYASPSVRSVTREGEFVEEPAWYIAGTLPPFFVIPAGAPASFDRGHALDRPSPARRESVPQARLADRPSRGSRLRAIARMLGRFQTF